VSKLLDKVQFMVNDKDFDLVNRFRSGDESAFNDIVREYQKIIYWHALRMTGNHMDADEVTQQVLIVIYQKISSFNFKSSFATWIYTIVQTRSLNQIRKNKLKNFFSFDDLSEDKLLSSNNIFESFEDKEKIEKLNKVLEKLPIKQKEVFIMRIFDQLTYEEISKITGKSVGGLKSNYFHALKKIMEAGIDKYD